MIPSQVLNILKLGAREGFLPLNVRCPCKCTFCYESTFSKMFPWIRTMYIPRYRDETFNFFFQRASEYSIWKNGKIELIPTLSLVENSIRKIGNELQYFPNCDFFNIGLTHKQIEAVVKNSNSLIFQHCFTGLNADFELIKYLSVKYRKFFRIHLSIITFDPKIRKDLMNPNINIQNLKKICKVAIRPEFYVLYFNKEQIIADIDILNEFSIKNRGQIYIHRLYYNKISPEYIKDYSIKAEKQFEAIIFYLKNNDRKLKNISSRLTFTPSSKIYAWFLQEEIKKLLKACKNTTREAIFCSQGAYQTIRSLADEKMHVVPIENCIGGCVDFAIGMAIKSVILKIKEMLADGIVLTHIYLPDAMFIVGKRFDLNGDGVDLIEKTFPGIKVNVIKIPHAMLHTGVTLDVCLRYFISQYIKER